MLIFEAMFVCTLMLQCNKSLLCVNWVSGPAINS